MIKHNSKSSISCWFGCRIGFGVVIGGGIFGFAGGTLTGGGIGTICGVRYIAGGTIGIGSYGMVRFGIACGIKGSCIGTSSGIGISLSSVNGITSIGGIGLVGLSGCVSGS